MPVVDTLPKLLSWGSDTEQGTLQQASMAARLPFVHDHVALMSDGHIGIGSTVGSVIPTKGAVVPAFAGVDLGCGMVAILTTLMIDQLPDSGLNMLMPLIEQRIPAGKGQGNTHQADVLLSKFGPLSEPLDSKLQNTALKQLGTLGSGNHFVEVCYDELGCIWIVLHSGSRGIGNKLAQKHMKNAKKIMADLQQLPDGLGSKFKLEDPDLAFLVQGTEEFDAYIKDMRWAQNYAYASREVMAKQAARSLFEVVGMGEIVQTINCHHNYTTEEVHDGHKLWITRKGAIRAEAGDLGVVPGSMGTCSYIVRGLGNPLSWNSSAHGAGRRMSRGKAKQNLDLGAFRDQMTGVVWNRDRAESLLDEAPGAYKDIDGIMRDQSDLSEIVHTLKQVFNYKG